MLIDADGTGTFDLESDELTMYGPEGIVGRSVVIHESADDLGVVDMASKLTGNAGEERCVAE